MLQAHWRTFRDSTDMVFIPVSQPSWLSPASSPRLFNLPKIKRQLKRQGPCAKLWVSACVPRASEHREGSTETVSSPLWCMLPGRKEASQRTREERCGHGGFNGVHAGGAVCVHACASGSGVECNLKITLASYWRVLAFVKFHFLNSDMDILRKVILLKRIYHISHPG